jgi:hypothetical protein
MGVDFQLFMMTCRHVFKNMIVMFCPHDEEENSGSTTYINNASLFNEDKL